MKQQATNRFIKGGYAIAHKLATGVLEKHPDHVLSIQLESTMETMIGDLDAACARMEKMIELSRVIIEVVSTTET